MSRKAVNRFLLVYLLVMWTAVIVRCDRFPLTWTPMYSTYIPDNTISVRILDKQLMAKGLLVTHRDGSTSYVSKEDLNIPKWNFWRLYYQRMFGKGPAKYKQGNRSLSWFNRWIRGLDADEANFSAEWDWRIFHSLNTTLGYEPADSQFIVRVQAQFERRRYQKDDLRQSTLTVEKADIHWKDEWLERWQHGRL